MRKTWRDKATYTAIKKKITRRRNPVMSYTQLAQEFGAPVYPNRAGTGGSAPSSSFRMFVTSTLGYKPF